MLSPLPPRLADWFSKPILAATVGNISKLGIPKADIGPMEQIAQKGKVPLLDIGTIDALKDGRIKPRPGIERFTKGGVVFTDGSSANFAAVVLGTGYEPAVDEVLGDTVGLLDEEGRPLVSGGSTGVDGLYFCGFHEPATGRLREIGLEAERIATLVAAEN